MTEKRKAFGVIWMAAVLLCTSLPVSATENSSTVVTSEESMGTVTNLETVTDSAGAPDTTLPQEPDSDHVMQFPFTSDVVFSGIYKDYDYYFQIPDYWKTDYVYAQVQFSVSQMITDVPATLTFSVNDTPVYSCRVDYKYGSTQVVYVKIPTDLLKTGYNSFGITGYVRIYDSNGCIDDLGGANWVSVSKNTVLQAGYETVDTKNVLSYYPYPFVSSTDQSGDQLGIYVASGASDAELADALLLRADLGSKVSSQDAIVLHTLDQYTKDNRKNRIVIATWDELPQEIRSGLDTEGKDLSKGALLSEYSDSRGNVLVVTSKSKNLIYEGIALLMDTSRVGQEDAATAYAAEKSSDTMKADAADLRSVEKNTYKVRDVSGTGLSFVGPFHQEKTVTFSLPSGFVLGSGGKVVLNYRYSKNLNFQRSMVTVYWGDTPIGSKKLTADGAADDSLSFSIPADVTGTGASAIKIAFDLELPDMYCTKRSDQMPWAYVNDTSSFYLPSGDGQTLDLARRPYPFMKMNQYDNTLVLIPDQMSEEEMDTLGQLMASFGSGAQPYGSIEVEKASAFTEGQSSKNIIVFGTCKDNSFISRLNGQLKFAFSKDGSRFENNDSLIFSEKNSKQAAVLQYTRYTANTDSAILVAAGTGEASIHNLREYLSNMKDRQKLSGDCYVIDSDLKGTAYTLLDETASQTVTLKEWAEQNKQPILFTVISTSGIGLLVLALILILIRSGKNAKRDRKNNEEDSGRGSQK
ncbi:MAG: cellulose biosynthesis cyclic di-GMP-binding regulatory protein BcsB [Butyrivibrio sp.]|jgi:hypothetical protein|nr:cellulose biosynthesis cyclic di-GMP-binding regulatory protein BcsB [Butyrivibrio sp.]